jgi:hypothetical protein
MFITLLIVTLVFALALSLGVVWFLTAALRGVITQIVGATAASYWYRFAVFALYVTGVAYGVDIYRLERYIQRTYKDQITATLDLDAWIFEIYHVIERTLAGLATGAMVIFVFSLIAFVIVRGFETRRSKAGE